MKELPQNGLESHPLWPLYRTIAIEQINTFQRLSALDFNDKNESDFLEFLQGEVMNRLVRIIARDSSLHLAHFQDPEIVITDPVAHKKYFEGWNSLITEAKSGNTPPKAVVMDKLDSLFEVWRNARKLEVENPFSFN